MLVIKNYISLSMLFWCASILANDEQAAPPVQECDQPSFVQVERPDYPSVAIKNNIMGAVVFQYSIDENGLVFDVELLGTNAETILQENAKKYLNFRHFNVDSQWAEKCKIKKFKIVYYYVVNKKCPEVGKNDIPSVCVSGCKISGSNRLSQSEAIKRCNAAEEQ